MRSRISAVALALAGLTTLGLAAGPAAASAAARPAPWCLGHTLNSKGATDKLWVWNDCDYAVSYKVKLAHVPDKACRQLKAHRGTDFHQWGWPGRFDGLVSC
jgi:hypothetical protein